MGKKGKKGKSAKRASVGQITSENERYKTTPHSFVFHRGDVGKNIGFLIRDMRQVMSPYSAKELKVTKKNVLKDFVNVAGILNVSHFVIFTKTLTNINMRLARLPRGPTLTFRVMNYSLCRDVISSLKRHNMESKQFLYHPLLIMNGFSGDGMHLKLMTSMFQHMFPSINVNKINLNDIRRCIILNYNPDTETIDFRHYNIRAVPVGMSRGMKKLIKAKVPDMSRYDDISDLLIKGGDLSESEVELDGEHNEVILPQEIHSRGNIKASKSAIRLTEIGPRMTLKLIKIQEGLCDGNIMFHSVIKKTDEEIANIKKHKEMKKKLKDERKKSQEVNVKKKEQLKEISKLKSLQGMKTASGNADQSNDDDTDNYDSEIGFSSDDDTAYYEKEVGSKPDKDLNLQKRGFKRKLPSKNDFSSNKKKKTSIDNKTRIASNKFDKSGKNDKTGSKKKFDKNDKDDKTGSKKKKAKTTMDIIVERKKRKAKKLTKQEKFGKSKAIHKDGNKQEAKKFINANKKSKTRLGFKRKT